MILNEKGWFIAQQTPVTMKHVDLTMKCWLYHQKGRFIEPQWMVKNGKVLWHYPPK
jgi:hypothetical protein